MRSPRPKLHIPPRGGLDDASDAQARRGARAPRLGGLPLAASIVAHGVIGVLGVWFWSTRSPPAAPPVLLELNIEEALHGENSGQVRGTDSASPSSDVTEALKDPSKPGAAAHAPQADIGRTGRGGSREALRATNLASSVDPITLEREALNHLTESEVQRLMTSRARRTRDDRRATPRPLELSFVATGSGKLALRRPFDPSLARSGERTNVEPSPSGASPGATRLDAGDGQPEGSVRGSVEQTLAPGVPTRTSGGRARLSAAVLPSRPFVKKDRAAIPAEERASPSDTVDSQQRVAGRVAALMQASTLGAERALPGPGGELGAIAPGSGSRSGWGARSTASGHGSGRDLADDPGLHGFYRRVLSRVEEALYESFPRWAIAEGRGGLVVFDLTLLENGRVLGVTVVRSSGIPEYDQNVLRALRSLPGFGDVPRVFGPRTVLRIDYDARNPIVGRNNPGPGRRAE